MLLSAPFVDEAHRALESDSDVHLDHSEGHFVAIRFLGWLHYLIFSGFF